MYPIVWFALMTVFAVAYAERANSVWGPQKRFYIDWSHAVALALIVIVAGFLVSQHDLNAKLAPPKNTSTTNTAYSYEGTSFSGTKKPVKPKTQAQKDKEKAEAEKKKAAEAAHRAQVRAMVAFHAVGITFLMWVAIVLWRRERWYPYVAGIIALMAMCSYYAWPQFMSLGNFVLMLVAVGFSPIGRVTTKRGFIVAYVLLLLFDVYAVWGSNVMGLVVTNYPNMFPKFLEGSNIGLARGIGAGDVIFGAIACNHIHQHRGVWRAGTFALLCTMALPVAFVSSGSTPLLIIVSPIAIAALLIPKGWVRID